jgi:hypothetical protein
MERVRICDGYYFPISTASAMSDFEADQEQCEATCPGTEVELFYQDAGDEDPGVMVSSVSGQCSFPTQRGNRSACSGSEESPVRASGRLAGPSGCREGTKPVGR